MLTYSTVKYNFVTAVAGFIVFMCMCVHVFMYVSVRIEKIPAMKCHKNKLK